LRFKTPVISGDRIEEQHCEFCGSYGVISELQDTSKDVVVGNSDHGFGGDNDMDEIGDGNHELDTTGGKTMSIS
jgi:hypothetical protein